MAVASPVLERNEVKEEREVIYDYSERVNAEEEHNARIKKNYAMLINPEFKIDEVLGRRVEERVAPEAAAVQAPYLVENARADAAIFRADSPVNMRQSLRQPVVAAQDSDEDEENEDLRPTPTTIQYKTCGVQTTVEEGKITNVGAEKRTGLAKKEKVIIAVVVSVIIALFALIIINSAIISGINSDLDSLQSSLTTVKGTYAGVSDQINSYTENISKSIEEFARLNGMIK